LEKLGISKDKLIYPTLCWSTHLNFKWVPVAKEARALGDISLKGHLLTEGILLTALRFAIQAASLLILFLDQGDAEALKSLRSQLDEHSSWWLHCYGDFRQRVDRAFDEDEPGARQLAMGKNESKHSPSPCGSRPRVQYKSAQHDVG
jgi:hypothetical protein